MVVEIRRLTAKGNDEEKDALSFFVFCVVSADYMARLSAYDIAHPVTSLRRVAGSDVTARNCSVSVARSL
jgi:hypothetical protein